MSCGCIKFERSIEMHRIFGNRGKSPVIPVFIDLRIDALRPIISGYLFISIYNIPVDIEFSPVVKHRIPTVRFPVIIGTVIERTDIDGSNTILHGTALFTSGRSGLVIVVIDIYIHTFPTVATISGPIINHVIAHIEKFLFLRTGTRAETRRTALVMTQQIVVIGRTLAPPVSAITVITFTMSRIAKALGNDAPLHRHIFITIYRAALVDTPTDGAVIDHDIGTIHTTEAVAFMICDIFIPQPEAQKTQNNVIGIDGKRITGNTDTIAGSRLSRNGYIAVGNTQR